MHMQVDIAFRFGTPEQRVKVVNFDLCTKPQKLIGYHSDIPWTMCKTYVNFIIRIHMSTNAENMVIFSRCEKLQFLLK